MAFPQEIDEWLAKSPTRDLSTSDPPAITLQEDHSTMEAVRHRAGVGIDRVKVLQARIQEMESLIGQMRIHRQQSIEQLRSVIEQAQALRSRSANLVAQGHKYSSRNAEEREATAGAV